MSQAWKNGSLRKTLDSQLLFKNKFWEYGEKQSINQNFYFILYKIESYTHCFDIRNDLSAFNLSRKIEIQKLLISKNFIIIVILITGWVPGIYG